MDTTEKEKIIKSWFDMWIQRDFVGIADIFDAKIYYSECYGPEYHGLCELCRWIDDATGAQQVLVWTIKRFLHQDDTTVVEWFFKDKTSQGEHGFDGVSIIEFGQAGKITSIKEFASKAEHRSPFAKGGP